MLELYWSIGHDLVALHSEEKWGKGIVKQFALDMRDAFPNDKGFSDTNIKYMKRWYEFYSQSDTINQISHQAGDQLAMPLIFGRGLWFWLNIHYKRCFFYKIIKRCYYLII